jgi:diguanylate cyclase (GGDEF)-like protein
LNEAPRVPGRFSLAVLQAENRRLQQHIDGMLHEARVNQDKLRRFDELECRVIGAPSLAELLQALLADYKALFELDAVTLALVDPQYEAARILGEDGAGQPEGLLLLRDEQPLQQLYAAGARPMLCAPDVAHDFLFEDVRVPLATVALLPLVHRGSFIGSLNLGSHDAARFAAGHGTDFLARLAALVPVCLVSALATERLKQAGLTDVLTGVHNRRYFESRCMEETRVAQRTGLPLSCLMLDVDHFKRINDSLGHPVGDEVLRHVARLIKAQLRGSDVVARYGGEEFIVLMPAAPQASALETAERIRRIVEAQSLPLGARGNVRVTISIGVAPLRLEPQPIDAAHCVSDMVKRADLALYQAKRTGRNRVTGADQARPCA